MIHAFIFLLAALGAFFITLFSIAFAVIWFTRDEDAEAYEEWKKNEEGDK